MNADLPARDDDQPPDGLPGPPGPPSLPARARPLRRRRRTLRAAALAAAAVLGAGVMTAVLLVRATPSWWQPPDPADARVQIIAAELEQGATAQLQRVRPEAGSGAPGSGAWTVHLSEDEANAWLAARLPDWIASRSRDFRWPEQLGRVQVDFRDGLVCLGAEVFASSGGRNPAAGQHVSASVRPVMTRNGALWTPARAFYVGRLPVPASLVLDEPAPSEPGAGLTLLQVDSDDVLPVALRRSPEARALLSALTGETPLTERPVLRLADGRRVRLLAVRSAAAEGGRLTLTFQTEGRE